MQHVSNFRLQLQDRYLYDDDDDADVFLRE